MCIDAHKRWVPDKSKNNNETSPEQTNKGDGGAKKETKEQLQARLSRATTTLADAAEGLSAQIADLARRWGPSWSPISTVCFATNERQCISCGRVLPGCVLLILRLAHLYLGLWSCQRICAGAASYRGFAHQVIYATERGEVDVGKLALPGVDGENLQERWPMRSKACKPYVFISHTDRDNVKEDIARPTHWFLENILGVDACLDAITLERGVQMEEAILPHAYSCTHALVILSPSYRMRKVCVQELNVFMDRRRRCSSNEFKVVPALWQMDNVTGYHNDVKNIIWIRHGSGTRSAIDFMIQTLWPALYKIFRPDDQIPEERELEENLVTYMGNQRNGPTPLPTELEGFYRGFVSGCSDTDSTSQTSSDGHIVGVMFSRVYKDDDHNWNEKVLDRKDQIEGNLRLLASLGTLSFGDTNLKEKRKRVGVFGPGRAVARLDCQIEFSQRDWPRIKNEVMQAAASIVRLLRDAGTTEEELSYLKISAVWEGSVQILLEARSATFEMLLSLLVKSSCVLRLDNGMTLVDLTPAFTVRGTLLRNEIDESLEEVVFYKHKQFGFLHPKSSRARGVLLAGGVRYGNWHSKKEVVWDSLLFVSVSSPIAFHSEPELTNDTKDAWATAADALNIEENEVREYSPRKSTSQIPNPNGPRFKDQTGEGRATPVYVRPLPPSMERLNNKKEKMDPPGDRLPVESALPETRKDIKHETRVTKAPPPEQTPAEQTPPPSFVESYQSVPSPPSATNYQQNSNSPNASSSFGNALSFSPTNSPKTTRSPTRSPPRSPPRSPMRASTGQLPTFKDQAMGRVEDVCPIDVQEVREYFPRKSTSQIPAQIPSQCPRSPPRESVTRKVPHFPSPQTCPNPNGPRFKDQTGEGRATPVDVRPLPPSMERLNNSTGRLPTFKDQAGMHPLEAQPFRGSTGTMSLTPKATAEFVGVNVPQANTAFSPAVAERKEIKDTSQEELPSGATFELVREGFPLGLIKEMGRMKKVYPIRFWVVDNSGSMNEADCVRLINSDGHYKMVKCSRWSELCRSVERHAHYAGILGSHVTFRLLNDPGRRVGPREMSVDKMEDVAFVSEVLDKVDPSGTTPMTTHLEEIKDHLMAYADELKSNKQQAVVVLATDGIPSDAYGESPPEVLEAFTKTLRSLQELPVWIVIRLCTSEPEVFKYYESLDLECSMEVMVDYLAEAKEIYRFNKWLNYGKPLHLIREMGYHRSVLDLLHQRPLEVGELRSFFKILFGVINLPDPESDWDAFVNRLGQMNEKQQWCPITGKMSDWVDLKKLNSAYGGGRGFFKGLRSFASLPR